MTGLSVADIDRWKPGDVREVFRAARGRAEANQLASHGLATLPAFQTWGGDAADAAKHAVGQTRKDLDQDGREALAVAMAADRAADGIESVQAKLAALRGDLDQAHLTIDPTAGRIIAGAGFTGSAADLSTLQAQFQPRLDAILGEATVIDEELAQAIQMADGEIPIPRSSPTIDRVGSDGLTPTQTAADARQEQDRRDAFRQVYGRDPVSANDWRMAEALDPQTYDPRYRGLKSNVVVGRFKPVPGAGIYRQNMYIPGAQVQGFEFDWTLQRAFPHMAGDNRGPSSIVPAEDSRVSVYADMANGVLVARQNPTMSTDGVEAAAGHPEVSALQGEDGSLEIFYEAKDPFEPAFAKPFIKVSGHMAISPVAGGNLSAGGIIAQYPSTEAYQYKSDGTTNLLFNRQVTTDEWEAAWGLALPGIPIGTVPEALYPNPDEAYLPPAPTDLGTAAQPPLITTVHLSGGPLPLPPIPVAALPLPVPTPPPLPVPAP
jgi:hypothetical protein